MKDLNYIKYCRFIKLLKDIENKNNKVFQTSLTH